MTSRLRALLAVLLTLVVAAAWPGSRRSGFTNGHASRSDLEHIFIPSNAPPGRRRQQHRLPREGRRRRVVPHDALCAVRAGVDLYPGSSRSGRRRPPTAVRIQRDPLAPLGRAAARRRRCPARRTTAGATRSTSPRRRWRPGRSTTAAGSAGRTTRARASASGGTSATSAASTGPTRARRCASRTSARGRAALPGALGPRGAAPPRPEGRRRVRQGDRARGAPLPAHPQAATNGRVESRHVAEAAQGRPRPRPRSRAATRAPSPATCPARRRRWPAPTSARSRAC
jgi:hypothetical protein